MAIKHIILLFVETPIFFVLKARHRVGRVVDRKLPINSSRGREGGREGGRVCISDITRTRMLYIACEASR
jgi:hypothetical protein